MRASGIFEEAGRDEPLYHSRLLEVKLKASPEIGAALAAGPAGFAPAAAFAGAGGLQVLLSFESRIRRITPILGNAASSASVSPVMSAFAAALAPASAGATAAGAAIVETTRDSDVDWLEQRLRQEPNVEVSRVPIRYLAAKKKAAKKASTGKKAAKAKKKGTTKAPIVPAAAPPLSTIWNLQKIRWLEARSRSGFVDAADMRVAVLDTGIDANHPDLAALIDEYDFTHPLDPAYAGAADIHGHGTHVAGTIAGQIGNSLGIDGVCRCRLFPMKIFNDRIEDLAYIAAWDAYTYVVDPAMYQRALARCLDLEIDVVNLSIGGRGLPSQNELALFQELIDAGVTIVAAMGNSASSMSEYPAAIPGVIAVGATSIDDSLAAFSNRGPHIALSAPGVGIWSTAPTQVGQIGYRRGLSASGISQPDLSRPLPRDTGYQTMDGTSMASPHVAAAVALLRAKDDSLTPADVKARLMDTAAKVPGMNGAQFTERFGAGRLDLFELLG